MKYFIEGLKGMLPITTGIIPFGLVMGTVCSEAQLTLLQSIGMNLFIFAGASQLASVDLMGTQTETIVVVATGLIINLRFMLYSAALSPVVRNSSFLTKLASAYCLTDQNYAVMSAHQGILSENRDIIRFYFGASVCMIVAWHMSVIAGYTFGNFAPTSWSLEYAVPLSFVALVIPSLKGKKFIYVAIFSSLFSIFLNGLPYNLGLIFTALLGIVLGAFLTRDKVLK
jgi:predicted branched-subunit amino acid permease